MRNWLRLSGAAVVLVLLGASGGWAQGAKFKQVTVTGRVVDNICMLGMGLKGEGHRECAVGCDKCKDADNCCCRTTAKCSCNPTVACCK